MVHKVVPNQNQASNKQGINNSNKTNRSFTSVPLDAIEFAIDQIKEYVDFRDNNDIDDADQQATSDEQWSKFYEWFYAACQ